VVASAQGADAALCGAGADRSPQSALVRAAGPAHRLFLLAGFIGKPFQQKLPVPPISDDEFYVLKLVQAINHDFANAGKSAVGSDDVDDVQFRVILDPDKAPESIPHRELFALLRKLRDNPSSADALKKIEVVLEPKDKSGRPHTVKHTAAELLGMQEALPKSDLTGYLIKAREMAKITSPNFTYTLLFLVSMIVLWSGCNNAAKEIVKEEAIYGRERAVNLGIVPYLASKFIVMSLFTIFQTGMLMLLVYGPLHLLHALQPGFIEHNDIPAPEYMLPYPEQFFVLSLLSMAGVALGLLLSACVSNPDRANALLPYVLIPQIILGGAIMPVRHGVMEWLAWVMSPEYWAFRAVRTGETTLPEILASVRMNYDDTLWIPCGVLVLETGVMLAVTAWFMRRKDIDRG
jgi:hypothetical protein